MPSGPVFSLKADKIVPVNGHVVVRPHDPSERTESGLYIPTNPNTMRAMSGDIVAVHNDDDIKPILSIGQRLLFGQWSGIETQINGQQYIVLKRDAILAILE